MTESLPTATPEEVGLSRSALDRLSRALSERTAAGNIPHQLRSAVKTNPRNRSSSQTGATTVVSTQNGVPWWYFYGTDGPAWLKPHFSASACN